MKKPAKNDPFAAREARLYDDPVASREHIIEVVKQYGKPCTFTKLCKLLKLHGKQQVGLDRRLAAMVRDGQLLVNRRGGYLPVNEAELVRGRVIGHPDGFGFFQHEEGGRDYFIPPKQMRSLLHGDRVIMRKTGVNAKGRIEVALIEVIERGNKEIVGRLYLEDSVAYVVSENRHIHQDVMVQLHDVSSAKQADIVVVEILEQPNRHHPPIGRVKKVLGHEILPGMEKDIAIHAHGIPYEWPKAVKQVIKEIPSEVTEADIGDRTDFRSLALVTIDGETSKDFDDAVYCEPRDAGGWRLIVAIADVSHYVAPKSAIDNEAYERGTSVYFANQVIPMLPEGLSNGICSLNPQVDRLCLAVEIFLDNAATVQHYAFHHAVMHSHARLTYTQVAKLLGFIDCPNTEHATLAETYANVLPNLYQLNEFYKARLTQRTARGAIDFETTETQIVFDDDARIEKIIPTVRNDAHKIIEESMILANIVAAKFISKHKMPALFRVHAEPPEDKLTDLQTYLKQIGIPFPVNDPKPVDYQKVIQAIHERPDHHVIQTLLLRSMSQAVYQPENAGHFGLALSDYAHFTSPIRRYPDLLVHRAISYILHNKNKQDYMVSIESMKQSGEHCSMTERRADDAARDAENWLKCEFMQSKIGQTFTGTISGVTNFGLFVELNDIYIEGLVHVTALKKDYYHHDAVRHALIGEHTDSIYQLGDKVNVVVAAVKLDEKKIDFTLTK